MFEPVKKTSLSFATEAAPQDESSWFAALEGKNGEEHWAEEHQEGELAIDVLETLEELIIVAPMAGTNPADIEVHLQNDCVTIRGKRPAPAAGNKHYAECYWGSFSRTIVLPAEVRREQARCEYKYGVLTVYIAKTHLAPTIPILVIEE